MHQFCNGRRRRHARGRPASVPPVPAGAVAHAPAPRAGLAAVTWPHLHVCFALAWLLWWVSTAYQPLSTLRDLLLVCSMVIRGRRPPSPHTSARPQAHAEECSDGGDVLWSDTSASMTPAHKRRMSRGGPDAADDAESDSTDLSGFIVDDGASDDKLDDDDSDDEGLADRGRVVRPTTSAALADRLFNDGPAAAAPPSAPRRRLVRRAESGV